MLALNEYFIREGKIGGEEVIVKIDEYKIGRHKYERSRVLEGSWIVGMIAKGKPENYRIEICLGSKRDETIKNILHQKPRLDTYGFIHETVNQSACFLDPETGACTQNIESTWRAWRQTVNRGGVQK